MTLLVLEASYIPCHINPSFLSEDPRHAGKCGFSPCVDSFSLSRCCQEFGHSHEKVFLPLTAYHGEEARQPGTLQSRQKVTPDPNKTPRSTPSDPPPPAKSYPQGFTDFPNSATSWRPGAQTREPAGDRSPSNSITHLLILIMATSPREKACRYPQE